MTKKDIIDIGKQMYEKNYIVAHDGNISFFDGEIVYITPSNVSKGFMNEDDIAEIMLDGTVINGRTASSEGKMHLEVYKNNKNARACVHSHPIFATTFACMGVPLDSSILAEAMFQLGDIPVAPYRIPGTTEAAESIIPFCSNYSGVLLEKHGLITWGKDLTEAFFKTEIAEFLARITHNINSLNQK